MRHGQGFLLVYSITDRRSFEEVLTFYNQIYKAQDRDFSSKIPLVLVANKCDLESERQVTFSKLFNLIEKKVYTMEGQEIAKGWKVPFIETSAKSRKNVDECFFELVREIRAQRAAKSSPKDKKQKKVKKLAKLMGVSNEKCTIL